MKLSIITVNLNNKEGLELTAQSVVAQVFTDFEWLVVDGGSTDGSREVMERYASRISWSVSEPDGGIYEAMNKGLERASGEYVQFLNSGDRFIGTDVLGKVFSTEGLSDVNYGDQWCISGEAAVEKRRYPDTVSLGYLFGFPLGHQASFIRTDFAKAHPYREKYTISADRAFFIEAYLSGAGFFHLDFPVVYFDTGGIGSDGKTRAERAFQLEQIKRDLLPPRAVDEIEALRAKAAGYDFVMRVPPLRWSYLFFKWIQRLKAKLRWSR